jgi:hypothetical protein
MLPAGIPLVFVPGPFTGPPIDIALIRVAIARIINALARLLIIILRRLDGATLHARIHVNRPAIIGLRRTIIITIIIISLAPALLPPRLGIGDDGPTHNGRADQRTGDGSAIVVAADDTARRSPAGCTSMSGRAARSAWRNAAPKPYA